MRPFLGIDLTDNKRNTKLNGSEFAVAAVSSASLKYLKKTSEKTNEMMKKAETPLTVIIGQWFFGLVGGLTAFALVNLLVGENSVSIAQAYQNDCWMFWVSGGCLLVCGLLTLMARKRKADALESDEGQRTTYYMESITKSINTELRIPASACAVDILSFSYKLKNGEPVAKETLSRILAYKNLEYKIFASDGQFFLADLQTKYAFPLSCLRRIRKIKKHICMPKWNKDVRPDQGIYKRYKLTVDDLNCVHVKYHYVLEIEYNRETWGIYFPCYELPAFEAATGMKAE